MKAMMLEFSTNSFEGWNICSSAIADSSFGESLLSKGNVLRNRLTEDVAAARLLPHGQYIGEGMGVKQTGGEG
jgi:hypothetical protein